jgi:hypothetical protein
MDYWDLRIIRAAVLHDLADFIPLNHYANAVSGIEIGTADWKLGNALSSANPAMTMRHAAAIQVLISLGLYESTSEALAHCKNARSNAPIENPEIEAAYDQSAKHLNLIGQNFLTAMRHYILHLPTDEAKPLLSLIEKTWETEPISLSINQEATTRPSAIDMNSQQPVADTYNKEILSGGMEEGSTQSIYDLFDPLSRGGIGKLFNRISEDVWREYFKRAVQNGLMKARQENRDRICYNPARVAEWLVDNGHYTQEEVDRKLANNLPQRSKGMKYRISGELD